MSTLKTHDLEDIVAVTPGGNESPGNLVRHVKDEQSFGTVVAHDPRPQGFSRQPQVTVLWSREPQLVNIDIQTQHINARSRPLRAKWSVSEGATVYGGSPGAFNSKVFERPRLEGEEEYGPDELDRELMERLHEEGADITFHSDGHTTVRRRADEPPEYLRRDDGGFNRTFRR